jgi:hypothetical protein
MKAIEKPQIVISSALILLLALIALLLSATGCVGTRIDGDRDVITETRHPQSFSRVLSQGSFHVYIIHDSESRVEVKAESNIQPYLYTQSDGTTLTIGYKNGYSINEHYTVEVYVYTPDLNTVKLSGSGKIECYDFENEDITLSLTGSGMIKSGFVCSRLNASVSGSGDIRISGECDHTDLDVSGSGSIKTADLSGANCKATVSGSGQIVTAATATLNAYISGSGNVFYTGNPVISSHITGSGSVLRY